jgi:hypothetical protein
MTAYTPDLIWSTNSDKDPKSNAGKALLASLIVGPPKATEAYTVPQLERQDIVGLYLPMDAPVVLIEKAGGFFLS